MTRPGKLLVVMNDLFFAVKINHAAKQLGLSVEYVSDPNGLASKLADQPAGVIFDLGYCSENALSIIRSIKGRPETKGIWTLGFVSHVNVELRRKAEESGCDVVVPRSVFAEKLPQLLRERGFVNTELP